MKKMKKIVILLIGLLIVSCTNDDESSKPTVNKSIVSITENNYRNDKLFSFRKLSFSNDQLTRIEYSDKRRDDYSYNSNGLVSKITEYDPNNILSVTTLYSYDEKGRISTLEKYSSPSSTIFNNAHYVFTYSSGKISRQEYNVNQVTPLNPHDFLLNSNNEIITDIIFKDGYSYYYTYANSNIVNTSFYSISVTQGTNMKLSYTNLKNDFNYKKYLFGKEWKLNNFLSVLSSTNTIFELSENLVSNVTIDRSTHQYNNPPDYSNYYKNIAFNYEFNESNQMTKETREITQKIDGVISPVSKSEFIFEYK
jgi:PBP1b-binding outer membrane lipoprotein LpoB